MIGPHTGVPYDARRTFDATTKSFVRGPLLDACLNSTADKWAECLIVGGGIVGAGAAYEISAFASVIVLERESHCGYHSTGRSAASFTENYGHRVIRRLAMASRDFLENPPPGFCEQPLLMPRGMITIAREDQLDRLAEELELAQALVPSIVRLAPAAAIVRVPVLRADYLAGAILEPDSREMDVNALHMGFLRGARGRGARVTLNTEVLAIERRGGEFIVTTSTGIYRAPTLINAAGAWADTIAACAGAQPLGLIPKRRTAFRVALPADLSPTGWPMVNDVGEEFYFKPDAGQLFVSPADASVSDPVDAYPLDEDIALGVERLERATTVNVQRVSSAWAGLRTFAADAVPVAGFDSRVEGFFWLAGQGGYGIKTSPALSRVCAGLLRGSFPEDLTVLGLDPSQLSPARLMPKATGTTMTKGSA